MATLQNPVPTFESGLLQEPLLEPGLWSLDSDDMVPAKHVVWASLALIAVTLAVLVFA
jgi:hypothetical protein